MRSPTLKRQELPITEFSHTVLILESKSAQAEGPAAHVWPALPPALLRPQRYECEKYRLVRGTRSSFFGHWRSFEFESSGNRTRPGYCVSPGRRIFPFMTRRIWNWPIGRSCRSRRWIGDWARVARSMGVQLFGFSE